MIFNIDFDDYAVPVETPAAPKKLQKCECGSWAIGVKDFAPGHTDYCPVQEDKTPVMYRLEDM